MGVPRVGVIVNPAAGRDIRRLTGGASVVDNYAKRRVAECVLAGFEVVDEPPEVLLMADKAGIAENVVEERPDVSAELLDVPYSGSAADTRRAAASFRESCTAIVSLGGDGTTKDVALECGDVPLLPVSTGTNNVVPTAVDGTVAGAAAALVATGAVGEKAVTERHGMVEGVCESGASVTGIASVELVDRSFVGTRAMIDPADLVGGLVSRASPGAIGLPGVCGALDALSPTDPEAASVRLIEAEEAPRTARAIVAPGVVTTVGIEDYHQVDDGESVTIDVEEGVLGADGERELEVIGEEVTFRSVPEGPRLVSFERAFAEAARTGVLEDG